MLSSRIRPLRLQTTQHGPSLSLKRGRHALNLPDQPTETSEDGTRNLRIRKNGSSMPLPPVMDDKVNANRMKWELPKPAQDKEDMTPFQKELEANPYAHALATPNRHCNFTRALLPQHFLIPFTYNMPKRPVKSIKGAEVKVKLIPAIHFDPDQACTYAAANQEIVQQMGGKKMRWESLLIPTKLPEQVALKLGKKAGKIKVDWEMGPEDLQAEIREKLGVVAVRFLRRCMKREKRLVDPLPANELRVDEVAGLLYFEAEVDVDDSLAQVERYHLHDLLSEEQIQQVRAALELKDGTKAFALLKHETSAWALMSLLKLRNFLQPAP